MPPLASRNGLSRSGEAGLTARTRRPAELRVVSALSARLRSCFIIRSRIRISLSLWSSRSCSISSSMAVLTSLLLEGGGSVAASSAPSGLGPGGWGLFWGSC